MDKTYIDKIDDIICYMNYNKSPIKHHFLLDNIEHLINEDGVPAIYITLKTNSPQMYYIIAEMTDFDIYADELSNEQKVLLTKMIFDRQPFAHEFNTVYQRVKRDRVLGEFKPEIDAVFDNKKTPEESFEIGTKIADAFMSIPKFEEPIFVSEESNNSENC